jgi:hypothetical protein
MGTLHDVTFYNFDQNTGCPEQWVLWPVCWGSMAKGNKGVYFLSILPDAETVIALLPAWFEDYNEVHPHSGLKFSSPREFLRLSA